ncbi:hypothetical protein [Actinocorallia sp. A-T 12471]|uniref:hypothetical protein n=1 Tax=Actinocorallia sp. A-T 12471 TaxID=3089813 RepID=UPI0029CF0586|nr:hypothetical protein [Actinocorallia sp. A-T 12471]MDX6744316.1 hypothetical protein [Actinocorallia sp. A-T 12471]
MRNDPSPDKTDTSHPPSLHPQSAPSETDEAISHLAALATALRTSELRTRPDFTHLPPTLTVSNPHSPATATHSGVALSERISAEKRNGRWTWCWSWGDEVAPVTDPVRASDRIRHVLRMPSSV